MKGMPRNAGRATRANAIYQTGNVLPDGDDGKAAAVVAGEVASSVTGVACDAVATAAGAQTAGEGGFVVGAACFSGAEYVGNAVGNKATDAWLRCQAQERRTSGSDEYLPAGQ
ncbi:hypothetical protein [Streptomyces pilosus]|uniref:hypothetical protein n=1 Tax=Streptomyces pilosus TaxID=28893 RepID=UPI003637B15B